MTPYDAWRLAPPDDGADIGTEYLEPCNRCEEPDEAAPRGYRPKPCDGVMDNNEGYITCTICGSQAHE